MQDLVEAMGIGRQSLYNTFGDKHRLYLAAMDRYCSSVVEQTFRDLEGEEAGIAEIEAFFARLEQLTGEEPERRACMLAFAAIERPEGDAPARERVRSQFERIEEAFSRAVENAIRRGEIEPTRPARALARLLTCSFFGLGVMLRAGWEREHLRDTVEVALDSLRR